VVNIKITINCSIKNNNTENHRVVTEVLREKKRKEKKRKEKKYNKMVENKLTEKIIGCAIEVHKILGPGLLESAYQECLYYELKIAGLKVEKEKSMPIVYKDIKLDHGYRIDL